MPRGARPSRSAAAARELEQARIAGLTPRERALLALRLGRRDRAWARLAAKPGR